MILTLREFCSVQSGVTEQFSSSDNDCTNGTATGNVAEAVVSSTGSSLLLSMSNLSNDKCFNIFNNRFCCFSCLSSDNSFILVTWESILLLGGGKGH